MRIFHKGVLLASPAMTALSSPAAAGLVGTTLALSVKEQLTPNSQLFTTSFTRSALVDPVVVEFPNVRSLFDPNDPVPPGYAQGLVDTSIDAGDDFITIGFGNAGSGRFASGYENTYVFTFESDALATITGATLDRSLTTLGLVDSDIRFGSNQLFVNVESLPFNANSFVRIGLDVVGGPSTVPEPASWAMMVLGLGIAGAGQRPRRMVADESL